MLRGFPGQPYYSDVTVRPNQMQDTLSGALVAARIRIQHHRFPSFESFSGRITSLYVLNKGPDAPDFGEVFFASHPVSVDGGSEYEIFNSLLVS